MNPKVTTSQTRMLEIAKLCDTPQICREKNSIRETYTKHNKITLTNITTQYMVLKTLRKDELHSVNKNINLIKNNMNDGQILDEVKHLRDDNNSKNTLIRLITENILDLTKSFSKKPNQGNLLFHRKKHAKNINENAATDKKTVPSVNRFSKLMFDYTDYLETGTNKRVKLIRMVLVL